MTQTCRSKAITLRAYQDECLSAIPKRGRHLVCLPCGSGKTVIFSRMPRQGRMLIISHRDELVHQPLKYFDCPTGIEQGKERSHGEEVVSASVPSLVKRLKGFDRKAFSTLIVDEAHHSVAKSYRDIINYFQPRLLVGFTATPNREDGVGLKGIYEDIVYEKDLRWMIEHGYLSDIFCIRCNIGYDLSGVRSRNGDYDVRGLEERLNIESANMAIAEAYKTCAKGQTLIFAVSVAHAEAIAKRIPGAAVVRGDRPREAVLEDFRRGKIRCIVNCMVLTEGTDLPMVETVIMARPTKSIALYTQCVGRGTRLYPGKERMTLIDCVGASRLDLCTAPSLLGLDVSELHQRALDQFPQAKLFDLPNIIKHVEDEPESWIKNTQIIDLWARHRDYDLHNVNWYKMPDGTLILSIKDRKYKLPAPDKLGRARWYGKMTPYQQILDDVYKDLKICCAEQRPLWDRKIIDKWGNYSATEKQKNFVKRLLPNWDVENLTKSEANMLITRLTNKCGRA